MLEISSVSNELIKKFISLKNKKYRDEYGLFLLDDIDLIKEAYDLGLLEYYLYANKPYTDFNCENIKTNTNVLSKLSSLENIPNGIGVAKIVQNSKEYSDKIIALDDVQDPGNGGTILRSALAFNFKTMLLSSSCFDTYNEKFIRSTKGAFFNCNIIRDNLVNQLLKLKGKGYEIVIADLNKNAINVNDYKMPEKMVLVVGNEGNGISKEIENIADKTIYIPINSKIESLNVGVAASIIMSKNNL